MRHCAPVLCAGDLFPRAEALTSLRAHHLTHHHLTLRFATLRPALCIAAAPLHRCCTAAPLPPRCSCIASHHPATVALHLHILHLPLPSLFLLRCIVPSPALRLLWITGLLCVVVCCITHNTQQLFFYYEAFCVSQHFYCFYHAHPIPRKLSASEAPLPLHLLASLY